MGIHEKGILNARLHLGFMPLFLVEHLVIPLNPNGPNSSPPKEMPNFDHLTELKRDPFTKECLLPIEAIKMVGSHPTKLMHNVGSQSPSPTCLNAIPKLMFHRLASVREAKDTLFGDANRCNSDSLFVHRHRLMPNRPNKMGFLTAT